MKVVLNPEGFSATWTPADKQRDLPRRFERALVVEGSDTAHTLTALIEEWASQVEAEGDTPAKRRKRAKRNGHHRRRPHAKAR